MNCQLRKSKEEQLYDFRSGFDPFDLTRAYKQSPSSPSRLKYLCVGKRFNKQNKTLYYIVFDTRKALKIASSSELNVINCKVIYTLINQLEDFYLQLAETRNELLHYILNFLYAGGP